MKTKKCFKCKEIKDIEEFYKHPAMSDGHLGKCGECTRKDSSLQRWGKIDLIRKYDRVRGHRHSAEYLRRYRAINPDKSRAVQKVKRAVASGRVKKPDQCFACGAGGRLEAHHKDYTKPLDVTWVCSVCHHRFHMEEIQLEMAI
jgi:hypothetical protein